ncbi:phosphopantetheine-binding protein [Nonomuraea sp. LP-02]|uniref:acyl carrier protein n=1 Tax=Nonomuraea TaxID=83681 RepID=UPI002E30F6B0|nr:phosphopantetheine-binding protein [Nonomuraea sp. LP-02]MED7926006.1 phosphopantetheine-binding protein [Nonomuraea sp. LP-02]
MSDEEILAVVRERCAHILKVDPMRITEDALLREDLEADSLDLAELHVTLEDEWGPLPREAFADVRTVGDVLARARELAPERLG